MAEPRTDTDDISARAAETAAEVTEAGSPGDQRRLVDAGGAAPGGLVNARGPPAGKLGNQLAGRPGGRHGAPGAGTGPGGAAGTVPRPLGRGDRRRAHRGRGPGGSRGGRGRRRVGGAPGAARVPGRGGGG